MVVVFDLLGKKQQLWQHQLPVHRDVLRVPERGAALARGSEGRATASKVPAPNVDQRAIREEVGRLLRHGNHSGEGNE